MENLKVTPRPVNVAESEFTIHGTNPLLCQKLPRNRLVEDLDKWPTTLKKITDELAWQYFKANLYLDENNYVSFPAVAVKKAGEEGGRFINGLAMNKIKGLFYINGNPPHGYVNICTPDGKPLEVPLQLFLVHGRLFGQTVGDVVEIVGHRLVLGDRKDLVSAILEELAASFAGLFAQPVEADDPDGQHRDHDQGEHNTERLSLDAALQSRTRVCHGLFLSYRVILL